MPLKLNVGLSKKVGQSNYGSRGACVNIELELDGAAVEQPDRLHSQIRRLYDIARESIEEELSGRATHGRTPPTHNGNGRNGHYSNGNGQADSGSDRPATASQIKATYAIAKRHNVDLNSLLPGEYGATRPDDLSLPNASKLIDELKGVGSR